MSARGVRVDLEGGALMTERLIAPELVVTPIG